MVVYGREDGYISQSLTVDGADGEITLLAKNIRQATTGTHATVYVRHGGSLLAYDTFNTERLADRVRLAKAAFAAMPTKSQRVFTLDFVRHGLDIFAAGLWQQQVGEIAGGLEEGDPGIGPPRQLVGSYCLEGGGTFAFAPPGAGKSYTLLAMAVSLDAGCSKVWRVPEPRRAMFVNLERSKGSLIYRLAHVNAALGLNPRRPLIFLNARGRSLPDIADGIAETVQRHQVEALFFDSISRSGAGDLTESATGNRVVDLLNGLCPTWIALAHSPRADASHIFGTMMFTAGADVEVRLTAETQQGVTGVGMEITKINDLPKPPLGVHALVWGDDGLNDIRPGRRHEFPELETGHGTGLAGEIADYLAEGKASPTEVAAALGRSRQAVSTILNHDRRFVAVEKIGRVAYFGLKATRPDDTSLSERGDT